MSKSSHMCVLLFMGIPGSGKTTLSKYFIEKTEADYKEENSEIIHICFDELAKHIYKTKNYKVFRNQAIEYIEDNIKLYLPIVNKKIVIIIDDIMYYSSMRKQVYNLCKKYKISYCQVYIDIPYEEATKRNALRTGDENHEYILPESIFQMSNKIEVPSSEPWERFTCRIEGKLPYNSNTINIMWDTIKSSLLCPVQSNESFDKISDAESSKQISDSHKIDIILRKFISTYITKVKDKNPTVDVSTLGKELSSKKKKFMEKLNLGRLNLDDPKVIDTVKNRFKEYILE